MRIEFVNRCAIGPTHPEWGSRTHYEPGEQMDSPTAYLLCLNGEAIPVDDEAKQVVDGYLIKHNVTLEMLIDRQKAIRSGIAPEDRSDFFEGALEGYDPETGEAVYTTEDDDDD